MAAVAMAGAIAPLFSCDRLHEDLAECDRGARIRFIYDWNMEFSNAFDSKETGVTCLTVLFYDEAGNYVTTRTNSSSDLQDENWRMTVDLKPGTYTILAYGGMECPEASFSFTSDPATTRMEDLKVELDPDCLTDPEKRELHHLFYGRKTFTVEAADIDYREVTVPMMKDTNNLRILLQQQSGAAIDVDDFDFKIIDNNTLYDWKNDIIPTQDVDYIDWTRGNASPGELPDHEGAASVAWAELRFARLLWTNSPQLLITRKGQEDPVVDYPLNNFLILLKSEEFCDMDPQEFLDRKSRWELFFILRGGTWYQVQIKVSDWTVRINNPEFE